MKKESIPSFYSELLSSWAELHYLKVFHVTQIQNEIIWNNTNINIKINFYISKTWHEKGIVKRNQLIENGSWKDFEQINEMMRTNSVSTIFQYARIKTAFPRCWFDKLTKNHIGEHTKRVMQNNKLFQIKTGDFIDITVTKAEQFYIVFVNLNRICHPNVLYFWQETLTLPEQYNWNTLIKFKFEKLFKNRVKQYNFKYLHRILLFKENLVQWKITSDMTCYHCKDVETVAHILLYCPEIDSFWKKIRYLICTQFNVNIKIDEKIVLIGCVVEN